MEKKSLEEKQASAGILQFWFGDIGTGFDTASRNALWFKGGKETDRAIAGRFGGRVERALAGDFCNWVQQPEPALALILLLDQFPRNMFRGQARAFAGDERARSVVSAALQRGFDQQLTFLQRTFLYMPLMHSESLPDQQKCVTLFENLLSEVPSEGKVVIGGNLKYARLHLELIERYGRFPHRNSALGRASTAEERAYLDGGGVRFGQ